MTKFCFAGRLVVVLPLLTRCARPSKSILVGTDKKARDSGTRQLAVTQRGRQLERHSHQDTGHCSTIVPGSRSFPFGGYCECAPGTEIAGPGLKCAVLKESDAWSPDDPDAAGCRCESINVNDNMAAYSKADILKVLQKGRQDEWDRLVAVATEPQSNLSFVRDSLLPELVHFCMLGEFNPNSTTRRLLAAAKLLLLISNRTVCDVVSPILVEVRSWPCGARGGVFEILMQVYSQDPLRKGIAHAGAEFVKSQATCMQGDAEKLQEFVTGFEAFCHIAPTFVQETAFTLSRDWNFTASVFIPAMVPTWKSSPCIITAIKRQIRGAVGRMSLLDFLAFSAPIADYRVAPLVVSSICKGHSFLDRVEGIDFQMLTTDISQIVDSGKYGWRDDNIHDSLYDAWYDDENLDDNINGSLYATQRAKTIFTLVESLKRRLKSKIASHRALFAYIMSEEILVWDDWGVKSSALTACQAEVSDLLSDPNKNVRYAGAHLIGSMLRNAQVTKRARRQGESTFEGLFRRSLLHGPALAEIVSDPGSSQLMVSGAAQLTAYISNANREAAERLRAGAQRGLNTSRRLSRQVGTLIPCTDDDISTPPGFMLVAPNSSAGGWDTVHAFRCPQPRACAGTRSLRNCSGGAQSMCAPGYDSTAPGCAACARGYGRQPLDPVTCRPCGRHGLLQRAGYVLPPTVLVAFGMRSAARAKKDLAGGLLNIVLSFAMSAFIVVSALEETRAVQALRESARSAMQVTSSASGAASALYSSSFDCLMGRQLSTLSEWITLSLLMPVVLFAACMLAMLVAPASPGISLRHKLLRPTLVAGNTFLPGVLAAFVRFGACIHTQENGMSLRAYDLSSPCPSEIQNFTAVLGVFLAACAVGPIYWALLIHRASYWDPRVKEEIVGYLVNSYNEESQWWGAVMLLRKLALATVAAVMPIGYTPKSHIAAAAVVMVASLIAHVYCRPFKSSVLNVVEGWSLAATCMSMAIAEIAIGGDENWSTTPQTEQMAVALALAMVALNSIVLLVCFLKALFAPADALTERRGPPLRRSTVH